MHLQFCRTFAFITGAVTFVASLSCCRLRCKLDGIACCGCRLRTCASCDLDENEPDYVIVTLCGLLTTFVNFIVDIIVTLLIVVNSVLLFFEKYKEAGCLGHDAEIQMAKNAAAANE